MVVLMKMLLCAQARSCFELPRVGTATHAGDLANERVLAIEQGNVGFGEIVHRLFSMKKLRSPRAAMLGAWVTQMTCSC